MVVYGCGSRAKRGPLPTSGAAKTFAPVGAELLPEPTHREWENDVRGA